MKFNTPLYAAAYQMARHTAFYIEQSGLDAAITGGILRVMFFGGDTNDADVAVLCHADEVARLDQNLRALGYLVQHMVDGSNPYAEQSGFLADWRLGLVNVIAYDIEQIPTFDDLIAGYDLNINALYQRDGVIQYPSMDITQKPFKVQNLSAALAVSNAKTRFRITRFKAEYPDLDWSDGVLPDDDIGALLSG